jgi:colanic acid/amylovoran biosynthesis glycosyltransferase
MRALFCMSGPSIICGPNVWLTRHLPRLKALGIEPRLLYMAEDPDEPCTYRTALAAQGIGSRAVRVTRYVDDQAIGVLEALAIEQPDLFIPNCSVAGYYASRYARRAGIRTIGIVHSDDPFYHDMLDLFVQGPESERIEAVVSVSDFLHDLARAAATPSTLVLDATYGVPIADETATAPGETLTLVYAGRLTEHQKRIARVADRLCDATLAVSGVRAVLYGEGPESDDVARIVDGRGAAGRVRIAGPLGHHEMMPAMQQGHAFVLLSEFEGLSIALIEAMACGLVPIVAPMRSGMADVIVPGVNALVVDPDDPASVIAAVRRLREEPGLWARMSRAARDTIVARGLTSDTCAARWADLAKALGPRTHWGQVEVPALEALELPRRCTRPMGFRYYEHRSPNRLVGRAVKAGRPIYVWGASAGGRQFLRGEVAPASGVAGVIDRRATGAGERFEGALLYPPGRLAAEADQPLRPYVVIASIHHVEIGSELEAMGYVPQDDFISADPASV